MYKISFYTNKYNEGDLMIVLYFNVVKISI